MKKLIPILLVVFLTLTTCGPDVKFVEPQPQGASNLLRIPKEYFGRFKGLTDSTYITVDSFFIRKEWRTTELIQRDSLEKELKQPIKCDTTIVVKDRQLLDNTLESLLLDIKFNGDSANVRVKGFETLFAVSDSQLVREYKGYCFLNFRTKDGCWLVKTIKVSSNFLDFSDLIDTNEIENIRSITKVISVKDTANKIIEFHINPTMNELRRILRKKKIENRYIRIL